MSQSQKSNNIQNTPFVNRPSQHSSDLRKAKRKRLAHLIGRLLAKHWLKNRTEADQNRGSDGPGNPI